ncbi:unnamed protein product [Wuchereria bancrofti]|uniref:Uncharacterized protein n=1 Tax=Wuchereria bancrofti TaxID=6293 RepID=A0A3P7G382_WUCBA|nr:unnamed protein product [Wuchereria bancrofti]
MSITKKFDVKDNSEQNKLLPQQSKKLDVRKQPFGPAPLPKGAISKGTITALGASNKQALQQIPITANQIKNDVSQKKKKIY